MEEIEGTNIRNREKLILQLYVSGMSFKSIDAIANIKTLCNEYFTDNYELEIIDLYKKPELAAEHHIVFSPSLIRRSPLPQRILVGNFSDKKRVLKNLGVYNTE